MYRGVWESETLLKAMLALMVADREERIHGVAAQRSEILLVDAGLTLQVTADLTGRSYEAVKKTVQRARRRGVEEGSNGA
jgi:hypothetical protein